MTTVRREMPTAPEAHARYAAAQELKSVAFEIEGIVYARAVVQTRYSDRSIAYIMLTSGDRDALLRVLPSDQRYRLLGHDEWSTQTGTKSEVAVYDTRVFFRYDSQDAAPEQELHRRRATDSARVWRTTSFLTGADVFCDAGALWRVLEPHLAHEDAPTGTSCSIHARMAAEAVRRACQFELRKKTK